MEADLPPKIGRSLLASNSTEPSATSTKRSAWLCTPGPRGGGSARGRAQPHHRPRRASEAAPGLLRPAVSEIAEPRAPSKVSAKLEALLDMLPDLLADGRRILLFSQFTSMLDLIKPELRRRNIAFVELRGATARSGYAGGALSVRRGPLFLISLKAGGTGLNLTAADTVIHYDPWWNPAVEQQATDRAHRIAEHPVFVYRLVTVGTVEARVLEMQARKAALAGGVFDDAAGPGAGRRRKSRVFAPLT